MRDLRSSHSGVVEDSSLLGCYSELNGQCLTDVSTETNAFISRDRESKKLFCS